MFKEKDNQLKLIKQKWDEQQRTKYGNTDVYKYEDYDVKDPKNMDEIKRMTHILDQATRMCDGKDFDFKNIMSFENATEIKTISLNEKNNQTISIQTQGGSPDNYLNGNQYQNSNDKDLFEWTQ